MELTFFSIKSERVHATGSFNWQFPPLSPPLSRSPSIYLPSLSLSLSISLSLSLSLSTTQRPTFPLLSLLHFSNTELEYSDTPGQLTKPRNTCLQVSRQPASASSSTYPAPLSRPPHSLWKSQVGSRTCLACHKHQTSFNQPICTTNKPSFNHFVVQPSFNLFVGCAYRSICIDRYAQPTKGLANAQNVLACFCQEWPENAV